MSTVATNIPAPLKTADVQRFAVRAAQVEKAKPAVAYWCYYYVLDRILSKGLHKTDDECQAYVVALMDKVEQMKTENVDDDAMRDDVAGKAYIEQFGLETFMRADNAIRANKASKQTADTFSAAYTFLDVLNIWPPVDPEITAKVKFAKFHAVRIIKAIKAGEDPNLSNPTPESEEAPAVPPLDTNDPEVQAITGLGPSSPPPPNQTLDEGPPQFVDQAPVSPPVAPTSLPPYPNEQSHPSTQSMPPHPSAESYYQNAPGVGAGAHQDVSPLPRANSPGYFPHVPPSNQSNTQASPTFLPGPPSNPPGMGSGDPSPISPRNPTDVSSPMHFGTAHVPHAPGPSHATSRPAPPSMPYGAGGPPTGHMTAPPPSLPHQQPPPAQYSYVPAVEVNDEAMARAQKHAKFAISALNFEDVNTAVKELRAALADLGQR